MTDTTTTTTPPPGETPEPAAPAKPFAWKPFAIVAAIMVIVVVVAMLVSGGGKAKTIDGTWHNSGNNTIAWTFSHGTLQTTDDVFACTGRYTPSANGIMLSANCGDHTWSVEGDRLALSADKNVAVVFSDGQSDACIVRTGSAEEKLGSSALDAQCTQMVAAADPDGVVKSDLRDALTAEATSYGDNQTYDASPSHMKQIEAILDWGGKLTVVVGDDVASRDMVCVSERSSTGATFSLASIADGAHAGTYYGKVACPAPSASSFAGLGTSW